MTSVLVTGRTGAGKTFLVLRLAEAAGLGRGRGAPVGVRALDLDLPLRRHRRRFRLLDAPALDDQAPNDPQLRAEMARTLRALREVDAIVHVLDADRAGRSRDGVSRVDREIARWGAGARPVLLVANKMDLPMARAGLARLRREFRGVAIIPASALTGAGVNRVRAFIAGRF